MREKEARERERARESERAERVRESARERKEREKDTIVALLVGEGCRYSRRPRKNYTYERRPRQERHIERKQRERERKREKYTIVALAPASAGWGGLPLLSPA